MPRHDRWDLVLALAFVIALGLAVGMALHVLFNRHPTVMTVHKAGVEPIPAPILTPPIKRELIDAQAPPPVQTEATPASPAGTTVVESRSRGILEAANASPRANGNQRAHAARVVAPRARRGRFQSAARAPHHAMGKRKAKAHARAACGGALDVNKITMKDAG